LTPPRRSRTTPWSHDWRSITLKARPDEELRETLAQLRAEVAALRASRERLVLAADADRRRIERDLHEGAQQHLIALAVNLQLAESSLDSDPAAARSLLEQMGRDVQEALDEAARLAQRIYATPIELGGLAAALRSAAVSVGLSASVDVSARSRYRPEIVQTVYSCWLEALEHGGGETPVSIIVREDVGALAFEVVSNPSPDSDREWLRDRVEALGGRLTVRSEPGGRVRVSGSLPLLR
jgi:signal transduction histidine kinase